jgi:hypothetical protein
MQEIAGVIAAIALAFRTGKSYAASWIIFITRRWQADGLLYINRAVRKYTNYLYLSLKIIDYIALMHLS